VARRIARKGEPKPLKPSIIIAVIAGVVLLAVIALSGIYRSSSDAGAAANENFERVQDAEDAAFR
jgi:hypothetical protein